MANEKFRDSTLSPAERAADLLSRLTLREKVGQVNQRLYGFRSYVRTGDAVELAEDFKREVERWGGLGALYGLYRADPWADKDYATGLTGDTAVRAYNLAQQYVIEHSRFGIPMLLSTECPHGHQALDGYLLPVNLAMGAAWNPALVEEAFAGAAAKSATARTRTSVQKMRRRRSGAACPAAWMRSPSISARRAKRPAA